MGVIEASIEGVCVSIAKSNGWIYRKLRWIGRKAAMDHYFLKGGRTVLIEFKKPGGNWEPLQLIEANRLRAEGAEVYLVDNVALFKHVLTINR